MRAAIAQTILLPFVIVVEIQGKVSFRYSADRDNNRRGI
jgi:hypothetical protein